MRGCELMYDDKKAQRMRELVSDALGECPCVRGERCPTMPRGLTLRVKERVKDADRVA